MVEGGGGGAELERRSWRGGGIRGEHYWQWCHLSMMIGVTWPLSWEGKGSSAVGVGQQLSYIPASSYFLSYHIDISWRHQGRSKA